MDVKTHLSIHGLPTNKLTMSELERLAILSEECGEVIQVIGKIMRHGYNSWHPNSPNETNRDLLQKELEDLASVIWAMEAHIDFKLSKPPEEVWKKKQLYCHFN